MKEKAGRTKYGLLIRLLSNRRERLRWEVANRGYPLDVQKPPESDGSHG